MEQVSHKRTAVVAGGGIGGLAAAAALAGAGLEVTVVERAPSILDVGSGLMLYANGVRAADAISARLGARVRADGHVTGPDDVRLLLDSTGNVLSKEPIGQVGERLGAPQIPILRTALQTALLDEAVAMGASVRLALAVEGYAGAPDGRVTVRLSDGSAVTADLLVAADGIKSAVRRHMLDDGLPHYRGYTSVRGRTSGSPLYPQPFVANGRGVQLFVAPVGGGAMYWAAKITAEAGVWPAMGRTAALAALLETLDGWHEPIVDLIRDADPDVAVTDIHDRDPAPTWLDGRVALLGDAAHPMVPAMGQGANMALEDAVVLAAALRDHDDVDIALKEYERQRIERTSAVVLHSRRQGALDQGASQAEETARNDFMKAHGRKDESIFDVVAWTPTSHLSRKAAEA